MHCPQMPLQKTLSTAGWLAGMNVHLAKPLDAEKMIIALKQCMADNSDVKLHEDL